jgi:hypothetical protein
VVALIWDAYSRLTSTYHAPQEHSGHTTWGSNWKSLYRADFLPGQYFDIRLEVHSPVNGSEARIGEPDPDFKFTITKKHGKPVTATKYFNLEEPKLENWNFSWYEGIVFP